MQVIAASNISYSGGFTATRPTIWFKNQVDFQERPQKADIFGLTADDYKTTFGQRPKYRVSTPAHSLRHMLCIIVSYRDAWIRV